MLLGGVCISPEDIPTVEARIQQVRDDYNMLAEFKWAKVSNAKLPAYTDLADVFFDSADENLIHFHSVLVDSTRLNHSKYNAGDSEIGFNKMIYQLLIKFGRIYHAYQTYHCFLDNRTTSHSLDELKDILNNGISKRWGINTNPYRRVVFRDSKRSDLLQLNDIVLGGLAARANGHHLRIGASPAKQQLSEYVLNRANITDPTRSTPYGRYKFTV